MMRDLASKRASSVKDEDNDTLRNVNEDVERIWRGSDLEFCVHILQFAMKLINTMMTLAMTSQESITALEPIQTLSVWMSLSI